MIELVKKLLKTQKYNELILVVNNLENKIPDTSTLIHINQYNKDKQSLEKKIKCDDKKSTR